MFKKYNNNTSEYKENRDFRSKDWDPFYSLTVSTATVLEEMSIL